MLRGCLTISFLQVGKFSIFLASTKKLSRKLFFFCSSFFPFHLPALSGSNCFVSSHFVCSLHYNPLCKPLGNPSFSSSPGLSRLRQDFFHPRKLSFHSKPEPGEAGTFHKVQLEFGRNKKRWSRFMVISLAAIKANFSGTPKDLRARRASVLVTKRKERERENSSEKSQLELCLLRKSWERKSQRQRQALKLNFSENWRRTEMLSEKRDGVGAAHKWTESFN